jgi:hypothetical protein
MILAMLSLPPPFCTRMHKRFRICRQVLYDQYNWMKQRQEFGESEIADRLVRKL